MDEVLSLLPASLGNAPVWLGVGLALAAATVLGEWLLRSLGIPRLTSYVALGMLAGPTGLGLVQAEAVALARPIVDTAMGLILLDLSRRLHPSWLLANRWLTLSALVEAIAVFAATYAGLTWLGYPTVSAGLVAAIVVSSSPAVAVATVDELRGRGQVSERLLLLACFHTVLALLLVKLWLVWGHLELAGRSWQAFVQPAYMLVGSVVAGVIVGFGLRQALRMVRPGVDPAVRVGIVMASVEFAAMAGWSPMLMVVASGLTLGASRAGDLGDDVPADPDHDGERDSERRLQPWTTSAAGVIFTVMLFVVIGASSQLWLGLDDALGGVLVILLVRLICKALVHMGFAGLSGLSRKQGLGLAASLTPISGLALLMTLDMQALIPQVDPQAVAALLAAIALMELIGPVLVRWGILHAAGEGRPARRREVA